MSAPPAAPTRADEKATAAEEPGAAAFGLLSRAQALADQLRSEVEAEVTALRAEAREAHDEASRVLVDATKAREDALSAQRSAQARLEEAQHDAGQLVADAADQATLVAAAAGRTSESLLASTQAEVDEIRNAASAENLRLRSLGVAELEQARADSTSLRSDAADWIDSRRRQLTDELEELGQVAIQEATSIRSAAQESSRDAISQADAEAAANRARSTRELDQGRAETAELRAAAAAEIVSLRDDAGLEADRVLAVAADHMQWAQETVGSLLRTADAEAIRSRLATHAASARHLAHRRRQLQDVISRVTLRVRTAVAEAAAEAERIRAQANAILRAAETDTIATRNRALAQADRVLTEADLTAQSVLERSKRRLDEAAAGARVVRERAAAEVARLQTEAHEHRRAVRDEATDTLAAARADADTNRTQARDLLAKARAEVKDLADRRDDITGQLGQLFGVIEALAVPERHADDTLVTMAFEDSDGPAPENPIQSPALTTQATTGTR